MVKIGDSFIRKNSICRGSSVQQLHGWNLWEGFFFFLSFDEDNFPHLWINTHNWWSGLFCSVTGQCGNLLWDEALTADDQPLVCVLCLYVRCEELSVHSASSAIKVLTPISVQLTLQPLSFWKTHTHTLEQTCWIPVSSEQPLFRAGLSPDGESWTEPKRKTREESSLFFLLSIPLPFSPHSLCVCHSPPHTLSLALFLSASSASSLFLWAVSRLHCSLSRCQSSATGRALKPNDSCTETEQPLCYLKALLGPASWKFHLNGLPQPWCAVPVPTPAVCWHTFTPPTDTKSRDDELLCDLAHRHLYLWLQCNRKDKPLEKHHFVFSFPEGYYKSSHFGNCAVIQFNTLGKCSYLLSRQELDGQIDFFPVFLVQ